MGATVGRASQAKNGELVMAGRGPMQSFVAHADVSADTGIELTTDQAYALWSETYDNAPNPLLALEERYLLPMLPPLSDKVVLDLGSGTGRLTDRLSALGTKRYLGIDRSAAMLAKASKKTGHAGNLLQADCLKLPLSSHRVDVIVCSFLLGYLGLH